MKRWRKVMNGNYYTAGNKIIIYCVHCTGRMRVPSDRGRISVRCPVCGTKFLYNPNSIFDTLKQVFLFIRNKFDRLPKAWKKRAILAVAVLAALIALFLLLSGLFNRPARGGYPGPLVHHTIDLFDLPDIS
jgi:DNA-directed RNA polymerase subunit RPC12/RpoP